MFVFFSKTSLYVYICLKKVCWERLSWWCCCAIRVSVDALCVLLDCVLGFFPCYFLFGCNRNVTLCGWYTNCSSQSFQRCFIQRVTPCKVPWPGSRSDPVLSADVCWMQSFWQIPCAETATAHREACDRCQFGCLSSTQATHDSYCLPRCRGGVDWRSRSNHSMQIFVGCTHGYCQLYQARYCIRSILSGQICQLSYNRQVCKGCWPDQILSWHCRLWSVPWRQVLRLSSLRILWCRSGSMLCDKALSYRVCGDVWFGCNCLKVSQASHRQSHYCWKRVHRSRWSCKRSIIHLPACYTAWTYSRLYSSELW